MTSEQLKEYSDPRRYNLILCLGAGRLQGWFVPYGRKDIAPQQGVAAAWTVETDRTLKQIENAVYDNPVLLEEYDCKLLIDTPRQLILPPVTPAALIEQSMKRIYDAAAEDVFTTPFGDAAIAYTLCGGLKAFLNRTFAGVVPEHKLSPLHRWFKADKSAPGRVRVYADIDTPWLHLLAYSGDKLLHASTHPITTVDDAAYFVFTLWNQLGLGMDDGQIGVSGNATLRRELMPILRRHVNYVGLSLLPRVEDSDKVPTPVLLAYC